MMAMEPTLAGTVAMPKAHTIVGSSVVNQAPLRPGAASQAVCHARVKSLDSFTIHDGDNVMNVNIGVTKAAAAEVRAQALQAELDRTRLVYGELLSAQDAEILRLRALLNSLGVDGDGLPLESDPVEA